MTFATKTDFIDNSETAEHSISEHINRASNLSPLIKWPGGKEKELSKIISHLPEFNRFFEPFVGGGSVFMGINANEYLINDLSIELIGLYNAIKADDFDFFNQVEAIAQSWENADEFFNNNSELIQTYMGYRSNLIGDNELKEYINVFCENHRDDISKIIEPGLTIDLQILSKEFNTNLFRKMKRMRVLEREKHELPANDIANNILTAVKSAVYMSFRHRYNSIIATNGSTEKTALFFFLRNYAYSGMFRYSKNGDFNVPYGGMAYNTKDLRKKLDYYKSLQVRNHFKNAKIHNLDFEEFLISAEPDENDFIFLDPPYDSEFSTYTQNDFSRNDHQRLAHCLIDKCKAKWMLIIKNTDFIYSLYNQPGIKITSFDKKYQVSFMNRNNREVTHLLITNY